MHIAYIAYSEPPTVNVNWQRRSTGTWTAIERSQLTAVEMNYKRSCLNKPL